MFCVGRRRWVGGIILLLFIIIVSGGSRREKEACRRDRWVGDERDAKAGSNSDRKL